MGRRRQKVEGKKGIVGKRERKMDARGRWGGKEWDVGRTTGGNIQ